MLRRALRNLIVGTPLEKTARGLFSRFDARCRASTAEMRDNAQIFEVMQRVLKPDSNGVDIGANDGNMLAQMIALAPQGDHYAFEPIPALAATLSTQFPRARIHPLALSDHPGTAEFQVALDTSGLSSLRLSNAQRQKSPVQTIHVNLATLDAILPPDYLPTLIKIDVEGAEYPALVGSRQTFLRSRPFLIFEFAKFSAENFHTTPEQMYTLLTNDFSLKISRLNDWLDSRSPLTLPQFTKIYHTALLWNFLAHP